jgi:FtsH-binding integral membrane protein
MASIAHLRGSIAGAAILTLFGSAWCIVSLVCWDARPNWSIPTAFGAAIALLALCTLRILALRNIPSFNDPVASAKGKRAGMFFGIIFGIEGLLIGCCSMLLAHFSMSNWIPIAAAVIVGLHFIPLARVFEVPLYYWTGGLIVLGMVVCSLIRNADSRVLCAGLVMGGLLWMSALKLLLHARPVNAVG